MEIFPVSTVSDILTALDTFVFENIIVVIGVVALAIAITFVVRWFTSGAIGIGRDPSGQVGFYRRR